MSFTNALENAVLDHILGGPDYSRPANVYLGLSTTAPNEDGTGFTEPSGGNYSRAQITNDSSEWNSAASGTKTNKNNVLYGQATAGWGTISHWALFDALSGGTMLLKGALTAPQDVLAGDIPSVDAGEIVINLD